MKILFWSIFFLFCGQILAQSPQPQTASDSNNVHNLFALEVNPSNLLFGEEGLILKIEPTNKIYYLAGLSYNVFIPTSFENSIKSHGLGTSVHAGFMFALNKKHSWYMGLQGFYRRWQIYKALEGNGGDVLDNYLGGPDILSYPDEEESLLSYNAKINVVNLDIIFNKQVIGKKYIFDYFLGFGGRVKYVSLYYLGYYDDPRSLYFYPQAPSTKNETQLWPDIKAGVLIGIKL